MFNPNDITDEGRLSRLVQMLTKNQTDVKRLWGRIGQITDSAGEPISGPSTPSAAAYTPAAGPTTTGAPTTPAPTTTTTTAPSVVYLFPEWDEYVGPEWVLSSGARVYSLLADRDPWPDNANFISIIDGKNDGFWLSMSSPGMFWAATSVELQIYCKNESPSDLLNFTAKILEPETNTDLTDELNIAGVGNTEGSFSERTGVFTLTPEAQVSFYWARSRLVIGVETDTEAGSPEFFISGVRVKFTGSLIV